MRRGIDENSMLPETVHLCTSFYDSKSIVQNALENHHFFVLLLTLVREAQPSPYT